MLQDMPLFPYRIYCYNELALRGYDLTVVSVSNKETQYDIELKFKHVCLPFKKIGGFIWIKHFSQIHVKDYDHVVITPNLRVLNFYPYLLVKNKVQTSAWGHMKGCTSGNPIAARLRIPIFKRMRSLIFYDAGTRDSFAEKGFCMDKMFVANNTQYVDPDTVNLNEERTYFLYVGRIQQRKGIDIALKAFAELKHSVNDDKLRFIIVGAGDNKELMQIIVAEGISNSVSFKGAIHDQKQLGEIFAQAIAYVSPGHVGLGVLHSLACGVPVITCSGRLHSVEISNCKKDNSLVVPYTIADVAQAMYTLYTDKTLLNKMSQAAVEYYNSYCTIDKMVDGIDDALKYVESQNK